MGKKMVLLGLGIVLLSGCATAQKSTSQTQQLQSRISYLESELQRKDQEIGFLERDRSDKDVFFDRQDYSASLSSEMSTKQIQSALKSAGYYKGLVDGKLGPKTKAAIKAFQKAQGLKADGVAGKKTQAELKKYR